MGEPPALLFWAVYRDSSGHFPAALQQAATSSIRRPASSWPICRNTNAVETVCTTPHSQIPPLRDAGARAELPAALPRLPHGVSLVFLHPFAHEHAQIIGLFAEEAVRVDALAAVARPGRQRVSPVRIAVHPGERGRVQRLLPRAQAGKRIVDHGLGTRAAQLLPGLPEEIPEPGDGRLAAEQFLPLHGDLPGLLQDGAEDPDLFADRESHLVDGLSQALQQAGPALGVKGVDLCAAPPVRHPQRGHAPEELAAHVLGQVDLQRVRLPVRAVRAGDEGARAAGQGLPHGDLPLRLQLGNHGVQVCEPRLPDGPQGLGPADHERRQRPAAPPRLRAERGAQDSIELLPVHRARDLHIPILAGREGRAAHVALPLRLHLHPAARKPADLRVKDGDRGQRVVQRQFLGALQPRIPKGEDRPHQVAVRPQEDLRLPRLDGQPVRDLQRHGPKHRRPGGEGDLCGQRIGPRVPVVVRVRQGLCAEVAVHHKEALEQPHGIGIVGEECGDVGQVPDRDQHHLVRVLPDLLAEEGRGVPLCKRVVRPAVQGRRALRRRVDRDRLQGRVEPGHDRDSPPRGPADRVRDRRPLLRLAADGRDPEQIAPRLLQQIGQADGVVDVAADVRIQQDLFHLGIPPKTDCGAEGAAR